MLKRLGKLTGTLNMRIPTIDKGILFNEPTKLQKHKHKLQKTVLKHMDQEALFEA